MTGTGRVTVAVCFWHSRADPRTVVLEADRDFAPVTGQYGVTVEGEVIDGAGFLALGPGELFVPYRTLIWMLTRPKGDGR